MKLPKRIGKNLSVVLDPTKVSKPNALALSVIRDDYSSVAWIRWWGPWRQYVLYTAPYIVLRKSSLEDIVKFLDELTAEQRGKRSVT